MRYITLALRGLMVLIVSLGVVFLSTPRNAFGHGKELEKKGGGPARVEVGHSWRRSLISGTDISNWLAIQPEVCRSIAWTTT